MSSTLQSIRMPLMRERCMVSFLCDQRLLRGDRPPRTAPVDEHIGKANRVRGPAGCGVLLVDSADNREMALPNDRHVAELEPRLRSRRKPRENGGAGHDLPAPVRV